MGSPDTVAAKEVCASESVQCRRHGTGKPGTAVPGEKEEMGTESRRDGTYPKTSLGSNAIRRFRNITSNSLSYDRF